MRRSFVGGNRVLPIILACCALFTGAALLAAVWLRLSLGLTLALFAALACVIAVVVARTLTPAARTEFAQRALAGTVGGLIGVACYDVVRFAVVNVLHLHVNPFAALPIFGSLITGAGAHDPLSSIAGTAYHYLNGVMFGVSYGIALGRQSWLWGLAWGIGLEALMLSLYPGWLHIDALLEEFTIMSSLGHLAYGTGLGLGCTATLRALARRAA